MLTGFCCFAGLEVPTSGQAEVYVPVIRGHVTCNLAKVVDAMIMDNPIVDEYDPFELPETA